VRLLRFAHPADAFYTSFREGERPSAPGPAPSATLVHRRGWVVWRTALSPAMAGLLEAIVSGVGLGAALTASIARTGEGVDAEASPVVDAEASPVTEANVTQWFREWVSGGVFTALELPEP
jgi:anti-sigma factor RsiW